MWRRQSSHDAEPATLPTVVVERCVHTRLTQASCRACVDACPLQAWVMDDDTMSIDSSLCDGCGLCAPACPQGAIVSQRVMLALQEKGRRTALYACEMAGIDTERGIIPCLHALGLQELLQMYRSGTRQLNIASGDCTSCTRGNALPLKGLVAQLSNMLANRNLDPLTLQDIPSSQWKQQSEEIRREPGGPILSRRNFFLKAVTSSMTAGMNFAKFQEEKTFISPGKLLPRLKLNDIVPFAPRIDPATCNGCDACARLCPQGAITLYKSDDRLQYHFDAESCTGCSICLDVCNRNAVSVDHWRPQVQFTLDLATQRCHACGVPFHLPAGRESLVDLCFVCKEANHARQLHQVIKQTH